MQGTALPRGHTCLQKCMFCMTAHHFQLHEAPIMVDSRLRWWKATLYIYYTCIHPALRLIRFAMLLYFFFSVDAGFPCMVLPSLSWVHVCSELLQCECLVLAAVFLGVYFPRMSPFMKGHCSDCEVHAPGQVCVPSAATQGRPVEYNALCCMMEHYAI